MAPRPPAPSPRKTRTPALVAGGLVLALAAFLIWHGHTENGDAVPADEGEIFARQMHIRVIGERPHDPEAFTQGLVLDGDRLYESIGRYGQSALREVDPRTGDERRRVDLPTDIFAEGLALAGDRLIQISWREQKALVWSARTFEKIAEHGYSGEGWGLCYDGRRLIMSDGSAHLTFRDPRTRHFLITGKLWPRLFEVEFVE